MNNDEYFLSINSRFFTYGSFPLSDTLAVLNKSLSQFKQQDPSKLSAPLVEEPRWDKPRSIQVTCSPQSFVMDPEKTTTVSVSYLLGR